MPAIHHRAQPVQRDVVRRVFGKLDVAAAGVVDAVGFADLPRWQGRGFGFFAEDVAFDQALQLVR